MKTRRSATTTTDHASSNEELPSLSSNSNNSVAGTNGIDRSTVGAGISESSSQREDMVENRDQSTTKVDDGNRKKAQSRSSSAGGSSSSAKLDPVSSGERGTTIQEVAETPTNSDNESGEGIMRIGAEHLSASSSPSFLFASDPATFFNFGHDGDQDADEKMPAVPLPTLGSTSSSTKSNVDKPVPSTREEKSKPKSNADQDEETSKQSANVADSLSMQQSSPARSETRNEDTDKNSTGSVEMNESFEKKEVEEEAEEENKDEQATKSRAPGFLNEESMSLMKQYLIAENGELSRAVATDFCDDDELTLFMVKMNRNAEHQTSFLVHHREAQKALMKERRGENEESSDSDDEEEENDLRTARLVRHFEQYEEEQELGKEVFAKMVQGVVAANASRTKLKRSKRNRKKQDQQQQNILDKRTLAWLKKATGIHGSDAAAAKAAPNHPAVSGILDDHGRRFTRGMAQKHRSKRGKRKKKQSSLDALSQALGDFEEEFGPIPEARVEKRRSKKSKHSPPPEEQGFDEQRDRKKRKKDERDQETEKPNKRPKSTRTAKGALANVSEQFDPANLSTIPGPMPLRLHDWMLRNDDAHRTGLSRFLDEDRYDPRREAIPTYKSVRYKDEKMTRRYPSWPVVNPTRKGSEAFAEGRGAQEHPALIQEQKRQYSKCCELLFTSLSGKARQRARFEFFYSDLDKHWYNSNDFVREATKLGVPEGTKLTGGEWKAVRRLILRQRKPRRFSRKFVADQVQERERYRRHVRMVQNNVASTNDVKVELDRGQPVPARIPVGSIVTAYNSRFRILQRGVVVSFETARSLYVVRFPPGYGNLFCPDFEVARHGLPEMQLPGNSRTLGNSTRQWVAPALATESGAATTVEEPPSSLASHDWGYDDIDDPSAALVDEEHLNPWKKPISMTDYIAEKEMMALVLGTVEAAIKRKRVILHCLKSIRKLLTGSDENKVDRQHYAWLLANLDVANATLEKGSFYMKTLYGPCYSPANAQPSAKASKAEILSWLVKSNIKSCEDRLGGRPALEPSVSSTDDWSRQLLLDSEDICRHILSDLPNEPGDDSQDFVLDRVSGIGTFLLASSYMEHRLHEIVNVHGLGAIAAATQDVMDNMPEPDLSPCWKQDGSKNMEHYANAISNQQDALQELKDAMVAWNAEMDMQVVAA